MRHRRLAVRSLSVLAAAFCAIAAAGPAAAADRVKVVTSTAVIRAEPNASSRALAVVAAGTVLDVLLRERDWYQVSVPAGTNRAVRPGYIEAKAVVPTTDRAVLVPVGPAGAAARGAAAPGKPAGLQWRVFGEGALQVFAATQSFKAIFGDDIGIFYGGGADFTVGRLFTQVSVTHFQRTGQRSFSYNGQAYRLGIADRVSITPIVVNVGYRFGKPRSRFVPYVAGGGGAVLYRETSDGSTADEDVSKTAGAFEALGGVEWRFARSMAVAFEGQYQSVRGVLGTGGVSQTTNEKDLGGASVRVKFLFGR